MHVFGLQNKAGVLKGSYVSTGRTWKQPTQPNDLKYLPPETTGHPVFLPWKGVRCICLLKGLIKHHSSAVKLISMKPFFPSRNRNSKASWIIRNKCCNLFHQIHSFQTNNGYLNMLEVKVYTSVLLSVLELMIWGDNSISIIVKTDK